MPSVDAQLAAWLKAPALYAVSAQQANGVFFDSSAGDVFTALSYPSDASLTVTASSAAFNSATAKALDLKVKRHDASILKFAFDEWTVDCSFAVNSFPDVNLFDIAAYFGGTDDALGLYAGSLRADNPSTILKNELYSANARALTESGSKAFSPGDIVRCQYNRTLDLTTITWTYPTGADHVLTYTQVFTAGINEMNRSFIAPLVRFVQANISLVKMVVSAAHPNPKFAFVGDSITKGYGTSTYVNGFASRIRAAYPGQTIVCGASGTATTDWLVPLQDVLALKPRYVFLLLGTNDNLGGDMAGTQSRYTALVNQIKAAGVIPITLALLPKGDVWPPIFNSWLAAQGWAFIDTYTPMLGTGNAMNASYTSDGLHPNDAGALALSNVVSAYITAQGLSSIPGGFLWGTNQSVDASIMSPLDSRIDALAEGSRHAATLGGPNVKDRILVSGRRRDLLFKCVTIVNPRYGYAAGQNVFVIGVTENENNTTTLTVIRRLPA